MLQISRIDVKTGLELHETTRGVRRPRVKEVEHTYLEHWLKAHGLSAQFYMGRFYDGVNQADRLRLEPEGKVLVFTNGKDGYFTDPNTARLMTAGDTARGISPIYAGDRHSPHNFVAYGSLVASDGMASTSVQNARLLVIDDENRTHGNTALLDANGRPVSGAQLERLYDKMGDGTMLVSSALMRNLITPHEEKITDAVFKRAGISASLTEIAKEMPQIDAAAGAAQQQIDARASRTVTQFRAATPQLPGLIKGTMASSDWCERLGVDGIISSNDIKGDDGRLSAPGLKTVANFWVNRKSDGRYSEQAVGPQVKGCIPEATLHEFNPRTKAQAEELAAIASDPVKLGQHYIQQKERQRQWHENEGEETAQQHSDWLYEVLKADKYGQLSYFSKINRELGRYLKGKWLDTALRGVNVPSAMAQHHAQLRPWEVCNKALPHGAIVAYYRSPFPNVGAAAIAINNTEVIRQRDREAFSKQGVAYLPLWTAKHVAITDFDRDANGYFVGYRPTVPNLPQQIRQQLNSANALAPAEQYEAGRSLFGQMIQQMEAGQENRIVSADYPLAVKEFIERNAPEPKPPEVTKQKKTKHPWHEGEPHSAATWRAWEVTADNPTGKVANAGMILQSLALEMVYAPAEQKEELLRQVSAHYLKQLQRAGQGKLFIPDDSWLQRRGFPAYHLRERVVDIAQANLHLAKIKDPSARQQFVERKLEAASGLLLDVVNGPNAENLQTAVDSAKSSRGIDSSIHSFARALSHKPHLLRQHHRDYGNYLNGKTLETNTQEPISWGVEAVNQLYQDVKLPELKNEAFRDLFPKACAPEQEERAMAIARTYNELISARQAAQERLRENRPEDQQPTLLMTASSGRDLVIQNLQDPQGKLPIWRASGIQPDWDITIRRDTQASSGVVRFPASLSFTTGAGNRQIQLLGYVAPEFVAQHRLEQRLQQPDHALTIHAPSAQIRAPFAQENEADELMARAASFAQESVARIPEDERPAYLSALWRQSDSMGFALKQFPGLVGDRLSSVPEIVLTGLQHDNNQAGQIPPGEYTARFSEYSYGKNNETRTCPSVAIVLGDGTEQQLGALSARSVHLPLGTTVKAHIVIEPSGKTARMQVLGLASVPESFQAAGPSSNLIALPTELPIAAEGYPAYVVGQPTHSQGSYSPSRQELRQWYAIALMNRDEPLKEKILEKGQQLRVLYGTETGIPGATPPFEYRHPSVAISEREHRHIQQRIAATSMPRPLPPKRPQLELG